MNKKIFGIKIGTMISFVVCIVVAFCIWLYANYISASDVATSFVHALIPRG